MPRTDGELAALEPLLTPREVAEILSVGVATLYGWQHRRENLVGFKVGSLLRYRRSDVLAYLNRSAA